MEAQKGTKLSVMQNVYIEWCATGCVWPKNFDAPQQIDTVSEFCRFCNVSRRTVYNWERDIADFWDRVENIRSAELSRKINKYYKWAEMSAQPRLKKTVKSDGTVIQESMPGSAPHLSILLGQSGRKRPEKQDINHTGEITLQTVDYKDADSE